MTIANPQTFLEEALTDLTVWSIVLISFTNALPTGGLGAFSNIILTAFVGVMSIAQLPQELTGFHPGIHSTADLFIGYCPG